uniref:CID domain-containing protein n=1 Tax=Angiostrongylus cantonensis TaxID=6313 RepID=A0A158P631_ANGCA
MILVGWTMSIEYSEECGTMDRQDLSAKTKGVTAAEYVSRLYHYFSILLVNKMDTESVKAFNAECKIEYKIPCLYVIDSIIRTSKHQLKEKDVFASRFLKNFSKTLSDLLSCPVCDQPRVIRTLNLWGANGVFTEEQLAPFKQQCRDMGIETDIERVERLVKGDEADMSRYGGAYGRVKEKDKRKRRSSASDSPTSSSHIQQQSLSVPAPSTTPPLPTPSQLVGVVPQLAHDSLLGDVSDLNNEPSDDVPPCGLSERKLLDMILDANFEFSGAFKNDIVLLRKAHGDLLSSQFDYSDEEDDGDDSKKTKRPNVTKVCQEDLLSIARNLIEDPNVIAAFKHMHAERILVLNQIAAQTQQRTVTSSTTTTGTTSLPTSAQIQGISLPKGLPPNISMSQSVPFTPVSLLQAGLPSIAGLPTVQSLSGLQSLAGLQSINLAQLSALNQANAAQPNQALLNLLANNSLVSKIGTLSSLQFANGRPAPVSMAGGLDPNQLAKQQELLQQLAASGKTTLAGVPATTGLGLLGAAPAQLIGPLSTASLAMVTDDNESDKDIRRKDRKRSRSRDRADHKKRRSRSKERKVEKVDRERRKLGLPALQEGMTIIASKTLWFGRLPINCSENDIKAAVATVGDISRVNLIGSRACAYATMTSRKAAYDVLQKLARDLQIARKNVKVDWAKGAGMKENDLAKYWDGEYGISQIPWDQLPSDMEQFCEGSYLDVESLPPEKRHMYLDTGALTTAPSSAAPPSKTDTSSPSTPPTSMHASPIKSLVPDSPAALAPIPQAVPPPATFPPFMGAPPVHRPNPFMGPPPQMVPPPGFPMRLPMPPGIPPAMPPGMPGHMFGMPPGGPGGLMMPPPTGIPPPAPIPPPSSIPPPIAAVSGMHSGPMRTAPPVLGGSGPLDEDTVDLEAVEIAVFMEIDSLLEGKMLTLLSQGPMKAQKGIVDARGTKRGIELQREVGMKVEMREKGITKEIDVVTKAEARNEEVGGMIRTIEAVADGTGEIDIEVNATTEIGTAEIGTATETGIANDEEIVIDQRGVIEVVEIVKIVKGIEQGKGRWVEILKSNYGRFNACV